MDCLGFLITFDYLSKLHFLLITVIKVIFKCLDSYFYRIMYIMKCNITFRRLIRNCNHMEIIMTNVFQRENWLTGFHVLVTQDIKWFHEFTSIPAYIYLFKVDNRNTRKRYEICSKLTIKSLERRHWRRSGIFIVCVEHISHLVLVLLLLAFHR